MKSRIHTTIVTFRYICIFLSLSILLMNACSGSDDGSKPDIEPTEEAASATTDSSITHQLQQSDTHAPYQLAPMDIPERNGFQIPNSEKIGKNPVFFVDPQHTQTSESTNHGLSAPLDISQYSNEALESAQELINAMVRGEGEPWKHASWESVETAVLLTLYRVMHRYRQHQEDPTYVTTFLDQLRIQEMNALVSNEDVGYEHENYSEEKRQHIIHTALAGLNNPDERVQLTCIHLLRKAGPDAAMLEKIEHIIPDPTTFFDSIDALGASENIEFITTNVYYRSPEAYQTLLVYKYESLVNNPVYSDESMQFIQMLNKNYIPNIHEFWRGFPSHLLPVNNQDLSASANLTALPVYGCRESRNVTLEIIKLAALCMRANLVERIKQGEAAALSRCMPYDIRILSERMDNECIIAIPFASFHSLPLREGTSYSVETLVKNSDPYWSIPPSGPIDLDSALTTMREKKQFFKADKQIYVTTGVPSRYAVFNEQHLNTIQQGVENHAQLVKRSIIQFFVRFYNVYPGISAETTEMLETFFQQMITQDLAVSEYSLAFQGENPDTRVVLLADTPLAESLYPSTKKIFLLLPQSIVLDIRDAILNEWQNDLEGLKNIIGWNRYHPSNSGVQDSSEPNQNILTEKVASIKQGLLHAKVGEIQTTSETVIKDSTRLLDIEDIKLSAFINITQRIRKGDTQVLKFIVYDVLAELHTFLITMLEHTIDKQTNRQRLSYFDLVHYAQSLSSYLGALHNQDAKIRLRALGYLAHWVDDMGIQLNTISQGLRNTFSFEVKSEVQLGYALLQIKIFRKQVLNALIQGNTNILSEISEPEFVALFITQPDLQAMVSMEDKKIGSLRLIPWWLSWEGGLSILSPSYAQQLLETPPGSQYDPLSTLTTQLDSTSLYRNFPVPNQPTHCFGYKNPAGFLDASNLLDPRYFKYVKNTQLAEVFTSGQNNPSPFIQEVCTYLKNQAVNELPPSTSLDLDPENPNHPITKAHALYQRWQEIGQANAPLQIENVLDFSCNWAVESDDSATPPLGHYFIEVFLSVHQLFNNQGVPIFPGRDRVIDEVFFQ